MARDSQPITTTPRHILWAAGAGAALLAGAFLLGVQAGKQSVALHRPLPADSSEPLQELPENLIDQLQTFEAAPPSDKPIQLPPAPKAEDAPKPADASPKDADLWTLQLVATPDAAEARKVAATAKAAGFPASIQKEKGAYKVRLAKGGPRPAMDAAALKLKKAGIKSFAVKAE
jgi:cell division protein FtsN